MVLTPQQLREIQFAERKRGYDPEQVERFRAEVAAAIEHLEHRVQEAEAQVPADDDGLLRRTLVLAQRTAEAAVAEARDTAAQLVAEAQQRGQEIVAQAEQRSRQLDERRERLEAELTTLEEARATLESDIETILRAFHEEQVRVRAVLGQLDRQLAQGSRRWAASRRPDRPAQLEPAVVPVDEGRGAGPADATVSPGGVGSGAVLEVDDDSEERPEADEAFFAELRSALDDRRPLGPPGDEEDQTDGAQLQDEEGLHDLYDQDGADQGSPAARLRWRPGEG